MRENIIAIGWKGIAFQIVAGGEGDADAEGNESGEEPGAEMEGNGGEDGWQDVANGIEADSQGEADHGDDEAGSQHAATATLALHGGGVHSATNHGHVFAVLQVAYQNNEGEKDGQGQ